MSELGSQVMGQVMGQAMSQAMRRVRHIHFVGIGGAGMGGIAELMHNLGYQVSGSDVQDSTMTRRLQALGIAIAKGHDAAHINCCDVLVVSSAIAADNPELIAARGRRIPVVPRAEMLAELMRFKQGIAVAGTHGKTTTTSLIASLLAEAGLDPTYVIGGRLNSSGANARLGAGAYLVAEADESDASFLHLQPVIAVLTNIDADHLDSYGGDFATLKRNFIEFLQHLPFYGLAVICADDPGVAAISAQIAKPVLSYALEAQADFSARITRCEGATTHLEISRPAPHAPLALSLNLPGRHNALNALAAICVASELGIDDAAIIRALENFQGIGRRAELKGGIVIADRSLLLIDDYAHHPREIEMILGAIRSGWPGRRLLVVFQPHRFSRTRALFTDFCRVLAGLEVLILCQVYAAGEAQLSGADSATLGHAIHALGGMQPLLLAEHGDIHSLLPELVQDEDILLTLGAGDIGALSNELMQRYGGAVH